MSRHCVSSQLPCRGINTDCRVGQLMASYCKTAGGPEIFSITHQRKPRSQYVMPLTVTATVVTAAPATPVTEQPAWH